VGKQRPEGDVTGGVFELLREGVREEGEAVEDFDGGGRGQGIKAGIMVRGHGG
jgi:hypothetical protein